MKKWVIVGIVAFFVVVAGLSHAVKLRTNQIDWQYEFIDDQRHGGYDDLRRFAVAANAQYATQSRVAFIAPGTVSAGTQAPALEGFEYAVGEGRISNVTNDSAKTFSIYGAASLSRCKITNTTDVTALVNIQPHSGTGTHVGSPLVEDVFVDCTNVDFEEVNQGGMVTIFRVQPSNEATPKKGYELRDVIAFSKCILLMDGHPSDNPERVCDATLERVYHSMINDGSSPVDPVANIMLQGKGTKIVRDCHFINDQSSATHSGRPEGNAHIDSASLEVGDTIDVTFTKCIFDYTKSASPTTSANIIVSGASCNVTLDNCIFLGDGTHQISVTGSPSVTVRNCFGITSVNGSITVDGVLYTEDGDFDDDVIVGDTLTIDQDGSIVQTEDSVGSGPLLFNFGPLDMGLDGDGTADYTDIYNSANPTSNIFLGLPVPSELFGGTVVVKEITLYGETDDATSYLNATALYDIETDGSASFLLANPADVDNGTSTNFTETVYDDTGLDMSTTGPLVLNVQWASCTGNDVAHVYRVTVKAELQ